MKLPIDLQLENDSEGNLTLVGAEVGEPEKDLIIQRARELSRVEGRRNGPQKEDFERAVRELAADIERVDENGADAAAMMELEDIEEDADARDYAGMLDDGNRQVVDVEARDEEMAPEHLTQKGVEDANHELMLEGHKQRGIQEPMPPDRGL